MEKVKIFSISRFFITLARCLLGRDIYGDEIRQVFLRCGENEEEKNVALALYSVCFTRNQITIFEEKMFQITTWLFVLSFFCFFGKGECYNIFFYRDMYFLVLSLLIPFYS